jgi:hypothetical protein
MRILTEGLDYLDMEEQVGENVTVDEYSAKMGTDSDIVTLTFTTNSQLAAEDLVTWFERGYDFVLDASVSDGEIEPGKYLVFVELSRRSRVPKQLITLLDDLETLTGLSLDDYVVTIEGNEYSADEDVIREKMILNPNEYKMKKEKDSEEEDSKEDEELNEFRNLAGLDSKLSYIDDEYTRNLKAIAGL